MRLGPIVEGVVADALRARLVADGFEALIAAEEGQVWVGHWVQIDGLATREEADRIVTRLTAGGLADAYVLQNQPPFTVSLGVYRDRAKAAAVAATATALGIPPQTTDRFRPGTQFWLSVVVPPGRTLPLEALGQEAGQILRAEAAPCATPQIGATGPIN
jgi:hypothetical protein